MNEMEKPMGTAGGPEIEQLRAELQTMRMLIVVSLLALIGLSICADYYLSHETKSLQSQVAQMQEMVDSFPEAAAEDFVGRLKEYSLTHPDFAPIAAKYPWLLNQHPVPPPKK